MKNQYFGDNRDLFKYDLIYQIIQAGLVNHFTFIPMLTKNDDSKQGGKRNRDKAKAGTKNSDLVDFLNEFEDKGKRDIKQLKSFFEKKRVKMTIYKKDEYFSYVWRKEYFEQIENKLLSNSLIFVDPDIGLEVKRTRDKHIRYCEVESLYERMDKSSILMIYQHFPRMRTRNYIQKYFCERSEKLKKIAGELPIYIEDNEIRLFFLVKDKSLRESLSKEISKYEKIMT